MHIEKHLATEFPASELKVLQDRVTREFGHVPIVQDHIWAEPTWIFLGKESDQIVSFLNMIDRQVRADGKPVRFFGLNNVITEPAQRGKGYSTALNYAALDFMHELDPGACGFLFCADDLIPFYLKLGWKKFEGQVTVSQPSADKVWPSNAMICAASKTPDWNSIHLCGLPW